MNRITEIKDSYEAMAISRLKGLDDFQVFLGLLKRTNDNINTMLRAHNEQIEMYRDQGAGQMLDEIFDFVGKAHDVAIKMQGTEIGKAKGKYESTIF